MTKKMQVWPGPRIMVPMATDVFLVGDADLPVRTQQEVDPSEPNEGPGGSPLSGTGINYYSLFMKPSDLTVQQTPFNYQWKGEHLAPGAHMMWTLPYALRRGKQPDSGADNQDVEFPLVPNRWLVTRFEYNNISDGTAPTITQSIVRSDEKSAIENFPPPSSVSQYPATYKGVPFSKIGNSIPFNEWEGDLLEEDQHIELTAMGPGATYWSVTYDNVQDVFTFFDPAATLSSEATKENPVYYTYLIMGWYEVPENDLLIGIQTDSIADWQKALQDNFNWTVGENESDVEAAINAWTAWQTEHGLAGANFDPSDKLAPQAKAAIEAWHTWQQANGETADEPDLAKQLLCHSMVSTVAWEGAEGPYLTATTNQQGTLKFPTIAAGNNAIEAISMFMANKIVNESGIDQQKEDIPEVARALEAFQKDLLYEYQTDPVRIENQLHNARFVNSSAGIEWIVTREESTDEDPSAHAGRSTIGLNPTLTEDLSALNALQQIVNDLATTIASQRNELYMLFYKQEYIENRKTKDPIKQTVVDLVNNSVKAITQALSDNLNYLNAFTSADSPAPTPLPTAIKNALPKTLSTALANTTDFNIPRMEATLSAAVANTLEVGFDIPEGPDEEKSHFILKSVDLDPYTQPNDPVLLVSGGELDTKLTQSVVNMDFDLLKVRYTGQFISAFTTTYGSNPTVTISAVLLFEKLTLFNDGWRAVPKETVALMQEALLLDTSCAALLAVIYFEQVNIDPSVYNAKTVSKDGKMISPLEDLTAQIREEQTSIWSDEAELEIPMGALVAASGYDPVDGQPQVKPSEAAVAFRKGQPWTPVFLDWEIKWIPNSFNSTNPFENWELGEIDYNWKGTNIPETNVQTYRGRSVLNPAVAQNIQLKLASFSGDSNYDSLPVWLKDDLNYAADQIAEWDILTQSITGFTEFINTKVTAGTLAPTEDTQDNINALLDNSSEKYIPFLQNADCNVSDPPVQQYAPIRSGHFQVMNIWVVDAFGQIMFGKNANQIEPLKVLWSESMSTPGATFKDTYGQLPPRLAEPTVAAIELLKNDDDFTLTNSSDATNPICGWVMPNHLDNSLMVFNTEGIAQGEVIKVRSEDTENYDLKTGNGEVTTSWSIRWDAAPGLNTKLGAPPKLVNKHLDGFINGLLATRFEGSGAYDALKASIDSTLWTMDHAGSQNGNLSLLIGRPLAVVRAQVVLKTAGMPTYQQDWCATGFYYDNDGNYAPTSPPYLSQEFALRVGDAFLLENGILGYFESDDYDTFYPVYGENGQTQSIIEIIRAGEDFSFTPYVSPSSNGYLKSPHNVMLKPDGSPVYLTLLVDPSGNIPIFPGSLPYSFKRLPNGPVAAALSNLSVSFRVGPVLLDPSKIKMPTPAEIKGKWSWIDRKDVTTWNPDVPLKNYTPEADLSNNDLRLTEGWLNLSDFETDKN